MNGYVRRILPFSSVDGPGNRTIIFLQGCGFNCAYCHNPETIPSGPNSAPDEISLRSADEVTREVLKYKAFVSGITISGGECTLQPDFLVSLLKALKAHNFHVLIDTNGDFDESLYQSLAPFTDGFMLDVKAVSPEAHKQLTGRDNTLVLENLIRMAKDHKLYEVRTVVVPNRLNNEETVETLSRWLSDINPDIRYKLIRFRPHGVVGDFKNASVPSNIEMVKLEKLARLSGLTQIILV